MPISKQPTYVYSTSICLFVCCKGSILFDYTFLTFTVQAMQVRRELVHQGPQDHKDHLDRVSKVLLVLEVQ